jgi:hypothetical protein
VTTESLISIAELVVLFGGFQVFGLLSSCLSGVSFHNFISSRENLVFLESSEIAVTVCNEFVKLSCDAVIHVVVIGVSFIPVHHFDEPFVSLDAFKMNQRSC